MLFLLDRLVDGLIKHCVEATAVYLHIHTVLYIYV